MALKVCQLCAVDFTLAHFLVPLIDGMRRRGWQVASVCSDGVHIPHLRSLGHDIVTIPIRRNLNPVSHLIALWRLYRLFREQRFDVVHVHTPIAALLGRMAARWAKIPLIVYTAHGFYFHDEMPFWKRWLCVALERLGGRWTDILFTQSDEDALAAVRERIAPPARVLAIGNGVDPRRFNPAAVPDRSATRRALGIPETALVVGIIGRLVREKGYGEFLAAATRLATQRSDVWFLLVGSRLASDHDASITSAVQQAQGILGERLIVTGFRADTPEMLSIMDVFCLPSYREGMPRTIIEAMMMGKPVVATNIRGAREEVVEGVTGRLVPTRKVEMLADALLDCLANPERRKAMGEAGRQRALSLYDEQRVVDLQIETIEGAARARGLVP